MVKKKKKRKKKGKATKSKKKKKTLFRKMKTSLKEKILIGMLPNNRLMSKVFGLSKQLAYYYRRKRMNPDFHPGKHGGVRWRKFTQEQHVEIKKLIWKQISLFPLSR